MGIAEGQSELGTAVDGTGDGLKDGLKELGVEDGATLGDSDGLAVSIGFVGGNELGFPLGVNELGIAEGFTDDGT